VVDFEFCGWIYPIEKRYHTKILEMIRVFAFFAKLQKL